MTLLASLTLAAPANAQQQGAPPATQPAAAAFPLPGTAEMAKLIWSTLVAVDHANRSGNYSVLRDISAQGFQANNDPAQLSQVFAGLRASRLDLAESLLVAPTYLEAPQHLQADVFRVRGVFQMRPVGTFFDLIFKWEQGRWKLFGIDLRPQPMATGPAGQAGEGRR